jgi:NADPH-dependent 2,4-dienoyl-CoA reductase/sulfur reductase-like enzyme/rhodanese-related sulfurtransferase
VIVGGVAGGASAAARLRRLDEFADITVIERGPDVSFANCGLPYHIGGEIAGRAQLAVQTPESLHALLNLQVLANTEATRLDRTARTVTVVDRHSGRESVLPYDQLVLAPGAAPLRPSLPGIDLPQIHTLRNMQDMDRIKNALGHLSSVLVIGAGFIGLEMAEQLAHLGKRVHLVELLPQILPVLDVEMVRPIEQELRAHHIDLRLGTAITAFEAGPGHKVTALTSHGDRLEVGAVILSIGVRPESALAQQAGLTLTPRGHIVVNGHMQTSDPAIYAVGDVCAVPDPLTGGLSNVPLGGPANRQGRTCADHIVRGAAALPYPGSIGTSIVRVFRLAAGITGLSERRLKELGRPYVSTLVSGSSHASYFPGAQTVTLKLLWEPQTGRVLGAQAYGADGVDKRLDVLATALRGQLTIDDLVHLELSYAPPFGSAKDVVNLAGFAATNCRDGLFATTDSLPEAGSVQLVDVRTTAAAADHPVAGAVNLPLSTLRRNLGTLNPSLPIVTVCAHGKTSYFAARLLSQHHYQVTSLAGGVHAHPELQTPNKNH